MESNITDRLKLYEALLAVIDQKRCELGDPLLGAVIERVVLDSQIKELEADILENPGAMEPMLVRVRRMERNRSVDVRQLMASWL